MRRRLRQLRAWWRVCPLWYQSESTTSEFSILIEPTELDMTMTNSLTGGRSGSLHAAWDTTVPQVAMKHPYRLQVFLPPDDAL